MDEKSFHTLELDKILARLAGYAHFSASRELLLTTRPSESLDEALDRMRETSEARNLIEETTAGIGGARDVRLAVQEARRGSTLNAETLLDIKGTLLSSAALRSTIMKNEERFPRLAERAYNLAEGRHIVAAVTRAIDDYGQVLDSASPALADTRRKMRLAHDRLHTKLQSIVSNSANGPYLQEAIITMRAGRYVIPIKAEAKGRLPGIVHDSSSSGATLFIEPLATVEINNQIRELELAEEEEVQRILREISALVGAEADALIGTVEALAHLDAAFSKARYASVLNATAPILVDFDAARRPGATIRLRRARHPLLDPATVVPVDVELEDTTQTLIITGPNTGGKTVTLKTVGLLALMAQCGMHIPAADGSTLTIFESVYADIGDEQSIEQSLSTFSGHLTNIIAILQRADERSLVLIDELGAGTDPVEGAALARAILNNLMIRAITTLVATHYPELKLYAHSTPGVRNASMEFNVETLSPTYRMILGLPGRSNALLIAARLGLPGDIIEEARGYVGEADLQVDDLLDEIQRARQELRERQSLLSAAERDVMQARAQLEERLAGIEHERSTLLEEAHRGALAEIAALQDEVKALRRRLSTISPTLQANITAEIAEFEALADASVGVDDRLERISPPRPVPGRIQKVPAPREVVVGDRVYVPTLNAEGEVLALAGAEVEVQVGSLRVRIEPGVLELRQRQEADRVDIPAIRTPRVASPGMEIHLRGLTVDEAIPRVEEYLDQAYLAGLPFGRIVHGRGSGALRKAVRDLLRRHPLVHEYRSAEANEGGDGATVVFFQGN